MIRILVYMKSREYTWRRYIFQMPSSYNQHGTTIIWYRHNFNISSKMFHGYCWVNFYCQRNSSLVKYFVCFVLNSKHLDNLVLYNHSQLKNVRKRNASWNSALLKPSIRSYKRRNQRMRFNNRDPINRGGGGGGTCYMIGEVKTTVYWWQTCL